MGLRSFSGKSGKGTALENDARRARFGAYFPGVFAYVQHSIGDENATREIVAESFTQVFSGRELREEEFRLALFGTARRLCGSGRTPNAAEECLTPRERDILALMFDAQLSREEVAVLLEVQEASVTAEFVSALKKLHSGSGSPIIPSFLRLS